MFVLIWIQTVIHSDSVMKELFKKGNVDFEEKKSADIKSMANYHTCIDVNSFNWIFESIGNVHLYFCCIIL